MPKLLVSASIVIVAMVIGGCVTTYLPTITYKAAGAFEKYNEILVGHVNHDLATGTGNILVVGRNTGLRCYGKFEGTYSPPYSVDCKGQKGIAELSCTDGRDIKAEFTVTSCSTGFGEGFDTTGSRFVFVYGLDEVELQTYIEKHAPLIANRPNLPVYRPKEVRKERGYVTGTGFFVSAIGHVITNFHVIDGATKISVVHKSGTMLDATPLAIDRLNDLALLKVDSRSSPLRIASSSNTEVGDEVFTLGYPLIQIQGQAQKATFGRINARSGLRDDPGLFQIDVPIQPGNSGGPLLDRSGNVVGVVTSMLNQLVTLRDTGVLPQSVNFAVKAEYLFPMLKKNEVRVRHSVDDAQLLPMSEVIEGASNSVLLILAK